MKNKMITARDVDFAKWFTDVVRVARLVDYSSIKGCDVLEPNGYAIWENIQHVLDEKFKELGHQNVYLPLFIPESLLNKEKEHVAGFAPEVAWVTHGGENKLEERMCVRPTSETLFCNYYANSITSYRDLPKLYNQWCNVVRWEKETRPLMRSREFLWQEGHTLHETSAEAEKEALQMLNVYREFYENYLAIPVVVGKKTEKEKFSGAEYTYTVEALMYNGVSLQSATSHYFGQKFTIPFNITFSNRENKLEHPYQTSWGLSQRSIGGIVMVHSDDNGLVLPPRIAPVKVAIIPIVQDEAITKKAQEIKGILELAKIKTIIDDTDKSAGFKFAEQETKGIPIRIEIGLKEMAQKEMIAVRRDDRSKTTISFAADIATEITRIIDNMHNDMYQKAKTRNEQKTYTCTDLNQVKAVMKNGSGFIKAMWCGSLECELKMKEINGIKARCIPFNQERLANQCVCCGQEAKEMVIWGIQY